MNQDLLDKFISIQKTEIKRSVHYIRWKFSFTEDQAHEVYLNSCEAVYKQIKGGKLVDIRKELTDYLTEVYRRQALKYISENKYEFTKKETSKYDKDSDEKPYDDNKFIYIDEKLDEILDIVDDDDSEREEKNQKVRDIVKNLPKPCDEIFWGMYRDGLSLKEIGEMLGYASYEVVKKTRQRCIKKFTEKFKY